MSDIDLQIELDMRAQNGSKSEDKNNTGEIQ